MEPEENMTHDVTATSTTICKKMKEPMKEEKANNTKPMYKTKDEKKNKEPDRRSMQHKTNFRQRMQNLTEREIGQTRFCTKKPRNKKKLNERKVLRRKPDEYTEVTKDNQMEKIFGTRVTVAPTEPQRQSD